MRVKPQPITEQPDAKPSGVRISDLRRSRAGSSWAIDAQQLRGVHYQQSYLGRSSANYYRGSPRKRWNYVTRPEALLLDEAGVPFVFSNCSQGLAEGGDLWDRGRGCERPICIKR